MGYVYGWAVRYVLQYITSWWGGSYRYPFLIPEPIHDWPRPRRSPIVTSPRRFSPTRRGCPLDSSHRRYFTWQKRGDIRSERISSVIKGRYYESIKSLFIRHKSSPTRIPQTKLQTTLSSTLNKLPLTSQRSILPHGSVKPLT